MEKHLSIQVFGKVQGVWFRVSTQQKAKELGIQGTVRNLSDGSVFIEASGTSAAMQSFIEWCHKGPIHARVDRLEHKEMDAQIFTDFQVIR